MARFGAKKKPKYRVTVADSRYFRNSRFIEILGHYNPNPSAHEKEVTIDLTRLKAWMDQGAQPSDRVKTLIKKMETSA